MAFSAHGVLDDNFLYRGNHARALIEEAGSWEGLREALSLRVQAVFDSHSLNHQPLIDECIQSLNMDDSVSSLLHDKWITFVTLPYSFRFFLEAGGHMDTIPLHLLKRLHTIPEAELYRVVDEALEKKAVKPTRVSGGKEKRCGLELSDSQSTLLGSPLSGRTSHPSTFLKEILKANGMTWKDSKDGVEGSWVQRTEPQDENKKIRQTRLAFLPNGECSPKYYSSRESNLIQRSRFMGVGDRILEVQLQQSDSDQARRRIEKMAKGFVLFGRFYELLTYKFERKGSFPRLFFVATKSFGPPGSDLNADERNKLPADFMKLCGNNILFSLRDLFGKSCRYISVTKLPAWLELLLSKTYEVSLEAGTRILYAEDIYGDLPGDSRSSMTDGAGLCSIDIAKRMPVVSSGVVSEGEQRTRLSVMQVRIFDDRANNPIFSKGMIISWCNR